MISAYMTDDITIQRIAYGSWGTSTPTNVAVKGRFEFKTKLVRNMAGEQVVSSANVILPVMVLGHQDKVVYSGVTYSILTIELKKDFSNRFLLAYLA
jgi:hypothetical protein